MIKMMMRKKRMDLFLWLSSNSSKTLIMVERNFLLFITGHVLTVTMLTLKISCQDILASVDNKRNLVTLLISYLIHVEKFAVEQKMNLAIMMFAIFYAILVLAPHA